MQKDQQPVERSELSMLSFEAVDGRRRARVTAHGGLAIMAIIVIVIVGFAFVALVSWSSGWFASKKTKRYVAGLLSFSCSLIPAFLPRLGRVCSQWIRVMLDRSPAQFVYRPASSEAC